MMRFLIALTTLAAAGITARAVPGTEVDPFNCALVNGCQLKFVGSTFQCSCVNDPPNSFALAKFYTQERFGGLEYQAIGPYKTCQNLPSSWSGKSHSMKSNTDPSVVCCIYTAPDCNKDGHHWTQVDTAEVAQLIGYYEGTQSYKCNLWVDDKSTCDGLPR